MNNPPRRYVSLYCSQPSPTQINSEDDIYSFPPIREGNRTPLASPVSARSPPPRSQAQETKDDSEAEFSDFPPIKECNSTPLALPIPARSRLLHHQAARRGPHHSFLSSEEESPQLQRHQQPNTGLGRTNILNMVDAAAPLEHAKVTPHTLFS